jgi:hypothetical protein
MTTSDKSLRSHQSNPLNLESLEPRMMLSTVSIEASGQEGGENMNVYVGEELVLAATVTQNKQTYQATLQQDFTARDVRIEFTNDLYQPAEGFDRNLIIDSFRIDDVSFDFNSADMFSTGAWSADEGIVDGFGRGNTLHTNGFFQFRGDIDRTVSFIGKEWIVVGDPDLQSTVLEDDSLELSGINGAVSASAEFAVTGGTLHLFQVDAYRDAAGSFTSDSRPWATVGVNYYGSGGEYLGQSRIDVGPGQTDFSSSQAIEFVTPEAASTAYVWIWIGGGGTDDIPIVVNDIVFEEIDQSGDTTPPEVEYFPFTISETTSEINFGVTFTDEIRFGNTIAEPLRITGPNGFDELAGVRTGTNISNTSQTLIFGIVKSDSTAFLPSDNGTYTVELLPNAVFDQAGNVTPGRTLGTFDLAIVLPSADTEAPGVSLAPISPIVQPVLGPIEFVVYTTDNRDPIPYTGGLTVLSNNGFEQTVFGIAGGIDAANDRAWQLYQVQPPTGGSWGPEDNGEYFIRLEEGGLVDGAGNEALAQVLGAFQVAVTEILG